MNFHVMRKKGLDFLADANFRKDLVVCSTPTVGAFTVLYFSRSATYFYGRLGGNHIFFTAFLFIFSSYEQHY